MEKIVLKTGYQTFCARYGTFDTVKGISIALFGGFVTSGVILIVYFDRLDKLRVH